MFQSWSMSVRRALDDRAWILSVVLNAVHPYPLAGSLAFLLLFSSSGQLQEVYVKEVETVDIERWIHLGAALASVGLLSACLYLAALALARRQAAYVYVRQQSGADKQPGEHFLFGWSLLCALLPWVGLFWGMLRSAKTLETHQRLLKVLSNSGHFNISPILDVVQAGLTLFERATPLLALSSLLVLSALQGIRSHRLFGSAVIFLTSVLTALVCCAPLALPLPWISAMFTAIGPVATISCGCAALFSTGAAVLLVSQKAKFPLFRLLFFYAVTSVCLRLPFDGSVSLLLTLSIVLCVVAAFLWRWHLCAVGLICAVGSGIILVPKDLPTFPSSASHQPTVKVAFRSWLDARAEGREAFSKYPVFVIAVEGGGIYAASAAASFLGTLQDRCPNFAQHVFAISGVSGGSMGAGLFGALVHDLPLQPDHCEINPINSELSSKLSAIIESDHLSPLVGFLAPDMVGTFNDRASALEESFASAVARIAPGRLLLKKPYLEHWDSNTAVPAFIFNATSVETGYRVAFAPFELSDLGGGTLRSFHEFASMDLPFVSAMVTSSRFPGILPGLSVRNHGKRQNFVDGGYSDASGALTALDIFNDIKDVARDNDVDLHLVLLTSIRPRLDVSSVPSVNSRDVVTPFLTLLNVRGTFWESAVGRALTDTDPTHALLSQNLESPAQHGADVWTSSVVEIDESELSLVLGWDISASTSKMLSLFIGDERLCLKKDEAADDPRETEALKRIRANSCVQASILRLLK